jgi:hypothetical protein
MDRLAELLRQGADRLVELPNDARRFMTNPQAFTQLLTGNNPMPRETGFAAGAMSLPPTEMSVLDPNQAPYMQGYDQGEPFGIAAMALPFAAPAAVATAKALAPKAGMMAENYMVKQGMIQPLTAYHGTPHTIQGQFDISKIKTGEGSNAYGAGMYFAENPAVAEMYQAKFAMPKLKALEPTLENTAMRYNFYDPSESATLDFLKTKFPNATTAEINEAAKKGKTEYKNFISKHANLYKVDIPDKKVATMLDINSTLGNQPENVKKFVQKHIKEITADMHKYKPQSQDSSVWERMNGSDLMAWAAEKKGNYDLGNQFFAKNNILGMKYLDEGSRKEGKGTSNYVVFDPSDVKILEENGKPITRKELIQEQINKIE